MSSSAEQRWVVAYDSPCDKRRRKLATLLEGYGVRVQHSVFECQLRPETVAQLQRRLQKLIHPDQDRVRLWPLSQRCCSRIVNLGIDVPTPGFSDLII
jgi:CRISPR-associated protein Cas2